MMAVLPVWRSPMTSSRWPRPIGISASMALRPVDIGSCTDLRGMMPGALTSTRRRSVALIGPLPSIGLPSASTTRPSRPLPTGTSTIAPVRLTVSPSLMSRSSPKMTTPTLSAFEVQRHAADAAGELDHLAGLDIVEAVDAGDAVADGEHLADFGDLGLLAEILDLVLQNCGNFRGADVHQPTSFSASLSELSLVLSDVSIWREPILTTRPPSSDGSTVTAIATSLPVTPFSAALSSVSCAGGQRMRRGDLGGDLAARFGGDAAERLDHGGNREQAAVLRDDAQEIADEAGDAGLVGDGRRSP